MYSWLSRKALIELFSDWAIACCLVVVSGLGVGFQFFAVGGQGALSGGDEVLQFGSFFGGEAFCAFCGELGEDVAADGVQGFLLLFGAEGFKAGDPAAHGAFRQVYGVDEGLLLALVQHVLDVFGELLGEFCSSRENLSH